MDQGRKLTDKKLEELENKIKKEYSQAKTDLSEKLWDYLKSFESKDKRKRDQLARGIISDDEYKQWRIGQIIIGKRWQDMLDNVSKDLINYQNIAKSIANGYMAAIYALNMNYATYDVENRMHIDTNFALYSREAVERILRDEPELLPPPGVQMKKKIAAGNAVRWQKGHIQSVATQAIIQGESVPNMATRIADVLCVSERKTAIRYARTAITEAENAGRLDAFNRMSNMGIKLKRTWIAVLDARTRHAHRELDGQTVGLDEPFVNSIGKIMYPGDPRADGANIWNCRCGMISQILGFETYVTDMKLRNTSKLGNMTYEEWKNEHGKSQNILEPDKVASIMRARYAMEYRK